MLIGRRGLLAPDVPDESREYGKAAAENGHGYLGDSGVRG